MKNKSACVLTFLIIIIIQVTTVICNSQSKKHLWKFDKEPVWSDEFNEKIIDTSKWTFETGGDGWGNNESQYYTNGDNAEIDSGVLVITARKETKDNRKYTSSRIITKNKAEWKYGRIIIRAKLPKGRGVWPAFWMLPSKFHNSEGVNSGEIDIMEFVGVEPDIIHFSIHTKENNSIKGNEKTNFKKVTRVSDNFHTYRMDWTPYGIRGYIDGKKYFEYMNNGKGQKYWPFDEKFFFIMNLAIGGKWGGMKGINKNIFPATLEVDYVRVYSFLK